MSGFGRSNKPFVNSGETWLHLLELCVSCYRVFAKGLDLKFAIFRVAGKKSDDVFRIEKATIGFSPTGSSIARLRISAGT